MPSRPHLRLAAALATSLAAGACATQAAYDGPTRPRGELAVIEGNPRFNAGLPVVVSVRRVGERDVGVASSRVSVLPGQHRLLLDCTVAATGTTSRHQLDVEVVAGGRYRLVADTAPGNQRCGEVRLEAR